MRFRETFGTLEATAVALASCSIVCTPAQLAAGSFISLYELERELP
jgi:hypothetical protein